MSLAALAVTSAAAADPDRPVYLELILTSATSLHTQITFPDRPQRKRLQLAARSAPPPTEGPWDMGSGGKQWSGLDISVDRKKRRCADCTRPLPDASSSSLCDRCVASAAPSGVVVAPTPSSDEWTREASEGPKTPQLVSLTINSHSGGVSLDIVRLAPISVEVARPALPGGSWVKIEVPRGQGREAENSSRLTSTGAGVLAANVHAGGVDSTAVRSAAPAAPPQTVAATPKPAEPVPEPAAATPEPAAAETSSSPAHASDGGAQEKPAATAAATTAKRRRGLGMLAVGAAGIAAVGVGVASGVARLLRGAKK